MQECQSQITYMECLHSTSALFNGGGSSRPSLGEESMAFDPNTDQQLSLHAAMEG